ncbi:unnamed protein product [Brachionus calyciflorus]|uniref:Kinesin motor domain-containing protein n=1 Tax=Brachionus calyciflorus TaxID=104777 RepID=A0A814HXF7_9BILA|nr:unnamed protein product [Brachionus calyciflorus]
MSIKVALRIIPPNEPTDPTLPKLNILDDKTIKLNDQVYKFNNVFSSESPCLSIYETVIEDNLKALMKGNNLTIMTYGQINSGKSYTIGSDFLFNPHRPNPENSIIQYTLIDLFNRIDIETTLNRQLTIDINLSAAQIYDGKKSELFNKSKIKDYVSLIRFLETNDLSNKMKKCYSHLVFSVKMRGTYLNTGEKFESNLTFIDLAGLICENKESIDLKVKWDYILLKGYLVEKFTNDGFSKSYNTNNEILNVLDKQIKKDSITVFIACVDFKEPFYETIFLASRLSQLCESNELLNLSHILNQDETIDWAWDDSTIIEKNRSDLVQDDKESFETVRIDQNTSFHSAYPLNLPDSLDLYMKKIRLERTPKFKIPKTPIDPNLTDHTIVRLNDSNKTFQLDSSSSQSDASIITVIPNTKKRRLDENNNADDDLRCELERFKKARRQETQEIIALLNICMNKLNNILDKS